jgi:hypothetical protein
MITVLIDHENVGVTPTYALTSALQHHNVAVRVYGKVAKTHIKELDVLGWAHIGSGVTHKNAADMSIALDLGLLANSGSELFIIVTNDRDFEVLLHRTHLWQSTVKIVTTNPAITSTALRKSKGSMTLGQLGGYLRAEWSEFAQYPTSWSEWKRWLWGALGAHGLEGGGRRIDLMRVVRSNAELFARYTQLAGEQSVVYAEQRLPHEERKTNNMQALMRHVGINAARQDGRICLQW